jgi:uncharacterized protein YjdB
MRTFILAVTGLVFSVTACSSYGTSVVEIKKTQARVASVLVSLPRSLEPGKTARATATLKDATGATLANRSIVWFSSPAAVATVTDSGTVSALAPGNAVVSAVSDGIAGQATLAVIAPPPTPTPVATVLVAINPGSVVIGQTAHATATPLDANGIPLTGRAVTWQSSNATIASVVATGDVSGLAPGTATISASTEGKTGVAALTVSVPQPIPVSSVSVSPATATLQVGGQVQLSAVTRDANNNVLTGRVIAWSSSNASIGTISALGLVTAIATGTVQITATSEGQTASSTITVSAAAPAPVASVSVSPATANLQVAGTVQLSAVTRDANNIVLTGRVIGWSSSNASIGTVSPLGLVTAMAAGSIQITASSEGKSAMAAITINAAAPPPVASVSVTPANPSVQVGGTVQLAAATRDANGALLTGRAISWTSSNTSIGAVSASGLVTGVAAGTAQITAISEGVTGTTVITVTAAPPPPPPPPPGGGWRGHEPSGFTFLSDQPFNSVPSNGWIGYYTWGIVSDPTAPQSPNSVLEFNYLPGFTSGISPGQVDYQTIPNYRQVYVSMYVKLSSNWQGERTSGMSKIAFVGSGKVVLRADGFGSGTLLAGIYLQGIVAGGTTDNGTTGIFTSPIELVRGRWHLLEVLTVANTGNNRDGSVTLWVDGALASSATGIEFEVGGPTWTLVDEDPIWGGGSDVVTSAMSLRVDHIYLSGKP